MNAHPRRIQKMFLTPWLALLLAAGAAQAAESDTVSAIWKPVDYQFSYQGLTTHYSCDGLEWKLQLILRAAGAHEKTRVSATGCPTNGPSRHAFVRIRGALPVQATPEARATVTKDKAQDKSRQELLTKLGIKPEIDQDEFPAQQKTIDLSRVPSAVLEAGDCELIEQLEREVFPALGIKVVRSDAHCIPGRIPVSTPRIEIAALVKAPSADTVPKQPAVSGTAD